MRHILACVHARAGDREAAFEALARAREAGRIKATQLEWDPRLDALREDPRFRLIMSSTEGGWRFVAGR